MTYTLYFALFQPQSSGLNGGLRDGNHPQEMRALGRW
jgi:hypothetical protein